MILHSWDNHLFVDSINIFVEKCKNLQVTLTGKLESRKPILDTLNNTHPKVLQNANWCLNKNVVINYFLQFCKQHKYTSCDKQTEQWFKLVDCSYIWVENCISEVSTDDWNHQQEFNK